MLPFPVSLKQCRESNTCGITGGVKTSGLDELFRFTSRRPPRHRIKRRSWAHPAPPDGHRYNRSLVAKPRACSWCNHAEETPLIVPEFRHEAGIRLLCQLPKGQYLGVIAHAFWTGGKVVDAK